MILRKKDRGQAKSSAPPTRHASLDSLLQLIRGLAAGPPQRCLGYEEAIGWFVDHRLPGDLATAGAILRTEQSDGRTEIVQLFLNAEGKPITARNGKLRGRRFAVDELDQELTERFGGTRLLMIN